MFVQGCNRTALEVCKLLLSLSPLYDPQCILLTMDYYAIKAQHFSFLLDFPLTLDTAVVRTLHSEHPWPTLQRYSTDLHTSPHTDNLDEKSALPPPSAAQRAASLPPPPRPPASLLPSLCFARALAAWHMEGKEGRGHGETTLEAALDPPTLTFLTTPISPSPPPPPYPSSSSSSSSMLHLAVLLYPEVVEPLLKQSGGDKEVDKAEWRPLLRRLTSLYPSSPYVDKLILVYTERSGVLWKADGVLAWLHTVVSHVVHTLDRSTQSLSPFHLLRAATFPRHSPPPPPLASLQRTQFTDAVVRLPPELLLAQAQAQAEEEGRRRGVEGWGGEADGPLIDRMSLAQLRQALEANGMQGLNVAEDHPLMALLRSLLPWNVVAPQVQGVRAGDGGLGGGWGGGGGEGQGWGDQQPVLLEAEAGELQFLPDEDQGAEEEDLGEH